MAQSHSINQAANGAHQTFTANFTPSFRALVTPNPSCGGNVTPSQDTMLADGTMQSYMANPATGFTFVGWSGDLAGSGTTNPAPITFPHDVLPTPNFTLTHPP